MSDVTTVEQFKKKSAEGAIVELPSGNKIRMKNPGMQVFLKKGMIPDTLTPIVQKAMKDGQGPDAEAMTKMAQSVDIEDMLQLFDDVIVETWVSPPVEHPPQGEIARSDDKLYTDEVEFNDKIFCFQFAVGGVKDLETFRQQHEEMLGSVPASQGVEDQSE